MWPREVADQVEMLSIGGGDAERLLHQAIWLVSVPIWPLSIHILVSITAAAVGGLSCHSPYWRWHELASAPLALHFSVCEKASRDSACAP